MQGKKCTQAGTSHPRQGFLGLRAEQPTQKRTKSHGGRDPQMILLEPEGSKFVLGGPTPAQKQLMEKEKVKQLERDQVSRRTGHWM